ncbi:hypothetical protein DL93DRAFT_2072784 [Clavulina sp. PMI_390]|nr:hypothetical protein DL93DRAFT_2072784 [Clavulina sp. PMI_390]
MASNLKDFANNLPIELTGWLDPSLLPAYLIGAAVFYFTARYVDNKWIRPPSKTGFGKGAPGFMTSTRKLKVTPEIAARLRRGEQVTPEEIDAAVRAAEASAAAATATATEDSEATADESPSSPPRRMTRSAMKKAAAASSATAKKEKAKAAAAAAPAEEVNEWIPETHIKKGGQGRKKR